MFETLSNSIGSIFDKIRGAGTLSEEDINLAMREVRVALLEADVALLVIKSFIKAVKEKAVGAEVVKSIKPGQMVIKIVQDELESMLGSEASELNLSTTPPAVIMMVGLQGSGKTTTTAKLANYLKNKEGKKCLMASVDIYRPAAKKQLEQLGEQNAIDTLPIIDDEKPIKTVQRALKTGKVENYDVVFIDTAGRLQIDDELMSEAAEIQDAAKPSETLLVGDALSGQDIVNVAEEFANRLNITGLVLTRIDGDSRGGAALSMKAVTGCPIKFIGVGEKISALDKFHPDRIAQRILGMGDIVTLVEKAKDVVDEKEAEKLAKKMQKGKFDFNDLDSQLANIGKMGGLGSIMKMMPGLAKFEDALSQSGMDEGMIKKQRAVISSMTKKERAKPDLINGQRKKRIAAGSGTSIQEVNQLMKQFKNMQKMTKMMKSGGKMKALKSMMNQLQ